MNDERSHEALSEEWKDAAHSRHRGEATTSQGAAKAFTTTPFSEKLN